MSHRLDQRLLLVLDTESTGIDTSTARVVELGAVYFLAGAQVGRPMRILVNPGEPIPPGATAVHKITDAMVADAPTFAEVAPRLHRHLDGDWAHEHLGTRQVPTVVGYNLLAYDLPLLQAEMHRANLGAMAQTLDGRRVIDPFLFAAWHLRHQPLKLAKVCERYSIDLKHAHAAWADAQATGRLLMAMLRRVDPELQVQRGCIPNDIGAALIEQGNIRARIEEERTVFGSTFYRCRRSPEVLRVGFGTRHNGELATEVPGLYWRWCLQNMSRLTPAAEEAMRHLWLTVRPWRAPRARRHRTDAPAQASA